MLLDAIPRSDGTRASILDELFRTNVRGGSWELRVRLVPFTTARRGNSRPALAVMAARDLRNSTEITGPILRLRALGDDDSLRYYLAVDDGGSRYVRAFRVSERQYGSVSEGDNVTVQFTPNLGRVRWIIPASDGV